MQRCAKIDQPKLVRTGGEEPPKCGRAQPLHDAVLRPPGFVGEVTQDADHRKRPPVGAELESWE